MAEATPESHPKAVGDPQKTSVDPQCESRGWTGDAHVQVENQTGETVDIDIKPDGVKEAWAWCIGLENGQTAWLKCNWWRYTTQAYYPSRGKQVAYTGVHGVSAVWTLKKNGDDWYFQGI